MMKTTWIVVLACALALPAGLRAAPPPTSLRYQLAVDVDAGGQVTDTQALPNVPAAMATLLDHAVRQWRFHPARRNRVAQPAHTWVTVLVNVQTLADGQGLVRVRYVDNGPRLVSIGKPPTYPVAEIHRRRSAFLMVTGTVDAHGKLVDMAVKSQVHGERVAHDFRAAAMASARTWHFEPVRVGGKPMPVRVRFPITYTLGPPGDTRLVDHRQLMYLRAQQRKRQALEQTGDARGMPLGMGQVASVDAPLQPDSVGEVRVRTAP